MRYIELTRTNVFVVDDNHPQFGELTGHFSRPDFESTFGITIPADVVRMGYEPDRGMYQCSIGHLDNTVVYNDPSENPFLSSIENIFDNICHTAVAQVVGPQGYEWDGSAFIITQETADRLAQDLEVATIKNNLQDKQLSWLFRMMLEMYKVGSAKGLWTGTDFDSEIFSKGQTWAQKLDRLKDIEV